MARGAYLTPMAGGASLATAKKFGFYVSLTGADELDYKLSQFRLGIQNKALRKGVRDAAKYVAERAKNSVPVDTGFTRKNIKVRAMKRTRRAVVGASVNSPFPASLPLEFGTQHMEAIPFMRRSLYLAENTIKAIFVSSVRAWITEYAKKLPTPAGAAK
jgi:HK97 gp10 family phage protein